MHSDLDEVDRLIDCFLSQNSIVHLDLFLMFLQQSVLLDFFKLAHIASAGLLLDDVLLELAVELELLVNFSYHQVCVLLFVLLKD